MTEGSLNVGELDHWEQIDDSGGVVSHRVGDGMLVTCVGCLNSAGHPPRKSVPRPIPDWAYPLPFTPQELAQFDLPVGMFHSFDVESEDSPELVAIE